MQEKIKLINDNFRRTLNGGSIMLTSGIRALPQNDITQILFLVQNFNDFTPENDPYKEHDFGKIIYHGLIIFWKIDYYDEYFLYQSIDPTNEQITNRVLTIMLAEEY